MSLRSTRHTTFAIERIYKFAASKVFGAWSTAEGKASWFVGPHDQWKLVKREFDFRVGGREFVSGQFANGPISTFDSRYHDIIANERIVYAYDMDLDGKKISVSLATVEFKAVKEGTRLIFTEQAAFLDDYMDNGSRERGTIGLLDQLGVALNR